MPRYEAPENSNPGFCAAAARPCGAGAKQSHKERRAVNADALSAWFGDNLEIAVLAKESDASRAQARQIVKTFFDNHTPRSFNITHTAGRANMKYALGTLIAGGEAFSVTIFMSCKNDTYKIQQLKIERL